MCQSKKLWRYWVCEMFDWSCIFASSTKPIKCYTSSKNNKLKNACYDLYSIILWILQYIMIYDVQHWSDIV